MITIDEVSEAHHLSRETAVNLGLIDRTDPSAEQLLALQDWVRELRSGDYVQGREKLRMPRYADYMSVVPVGMSYCCLGVACVLIGGKWDDTGWKSPGDIRVPMGETTNLEPEFRPRYGLKDHGIGRLAKCNDSGAWGFDAIADELEAWFDLPNTNPNGDVWDRTTFITFAQEMEGQS